MKVKWLLGKGTFQENIHLIAEEIQRQGMEYKIVDYMPFNDDVNFDEYDENDCVVFYGSIGHANLIRRKSKWIPGVFYNQKAYDCRNYYPALGQYLLNSNYLMLPFGELLRQKDFLYEKLGIDDVVFMRPDYGGKSFTGTLVYKETYEKFLDTIGFGQLEAGALIVVAEPRNLIGEWRFIVVDGKVVTGSQYRSDVGIKYKAEWPSEAILLAQKIANSYSPDKAWVVDICQTKEGNFYLLEIGCFSCAGIYLCDREIIIREISKIALKEWEEYQDI
jgi:hypothetical protein